MAFALKAVPRLDDDEAIARLADGAPGWQIEFDAAGTMLVSPVFSDGGARELAAGVQLAAYAALHGGRAFGSSTGFRLADGSLRSPDASWLSAERIAGLRDDERTKFWRVCPDVVIEILSASDAWDDLLGKLDAYRASGARYAVAIDPSRRVTHALGEAPPGFSIDWEAIVDA